MPAVTVRRMLLAIGMLSATAVGVGSSHVPLHVGDVVEFGHVAVFLHVGALVLGHAGDEVVDDLVRDERVTKVKFGDVGLGRGCKRATHTIRDRSDNSPCRRQLL